MYIHYKEKLRKVFDMYNSPFIKYIDIFDMYTLLNMLIGNFVIFDITYKLFHKKGLGE